MEATDTVTSTPAGRGTRVAVVDGLRGLASLSVCWYHLVFASQAFTGGGLVAATLRNSARDDWVGVEIFFVISGFVIPLALFRSQYTARSYGYFLVKRIARLEPPYLVSVGLSAALWYLWSVIPKLHGPAFTLTVGGLLLHIGYLNAFFHQGWLNPVYWTLAIEFQYYLGMGLLFSAFVARRPVIRYAAFAVLGALALLIPNPSLVFHYLFVFLLGLATFQHRAELLPLRGYLPTLGLLALGCAVTLGPMIAGVSVFTALIIAFVRREIPILSFLGTISYSLYLIHVPIGGRILGLGLSHVHSGLARTAILGLTLALTVGAAALFHRFVERPAQRWSSAIGYRRRSIGPGRRTAPVVTGIADP